MKKIIILNGAGKKNGDTSALVKAFIEGTEDSGNSVKEFYLQNMTINGCMDCQGCARTEKGSANPCIQTDDMEKIYAAFVEADVVVFASPMYWWTITGTLKIAVDRLYALYRNAGNAAYQKESVLLMTAGSYDYSQPLAWYEGFESYMGWRNRGAILGIGKINEARKLGKNIN